MTHICVGQREMNCVRLYCVTLFSFPPHPSFKQSKEFPADMIF